MTAPIGTLLILLCLLQIKHMFADYFLQTPRMLSGRGQYLHLGRAEHAGVHALGSVIAFLLVGAPLPFIVVIVILEWILHFHIDFWKARQCDQKQLDPFKPAFWRASGVDQALHQFTYVAMIWAWAEFAV
ncbi:DUF3307 domain-containing protein [Pseudodonghicola flavimaris]|uniref:DUF3307 domain-containing protein n=1 Tax=Pseudodonghicola flavimaris TaxID=3050036 RepID=A0ABT7EXX3_9RHOB|nr:DUF3307 domain-containing protein [Pseudodonghicola flavimaris]MDK3017191.1 DUF3307 domain-containing protein [Pseudodonghicola flavimaris]